MSKKQKPTEKVADQKQAEEQNNATNAENASQQNISNNDEAEQKATEPTPEKTEEKKSEPDINALYEEMKDKYLRLSAEFDNYRKRTLREKADMLKFGSEDTLKDLLPVIDDLDRALKAIETATEIKAVKDGLQLITNKFYEFLKTKGVKEIEAVGKELDTDLHEAITKIPAPQEDMKGKIVDVIQKGYTIHEKVMRFSKVVVGE